MITAWKPVRGPARTVGRRADDRPAARSAVRIERIVSHAQASPPGFWYDQDGPNGWWCSPGRPAFCSRGDAEPRSLAAGDYVHIPAHARHRVEWTDPQTPTVWLAIHICPA